MRVGSGSCDHANEPSASIKDAEFVYWLIILQLPKKVAIVWC
jgi:hypothetical protein